MASNDCFNNETDPDNDNDFWDKLETISTFDLSDTNNNIATTLAVTSAPTSTTTTTTTSVPYLNSSLLNNKDVFKEISRLLKPYQTTPISIIVQSLLLHVSAQYSTYNKTHFYYALCERLHQMGIIDNSYLKTEFEDVRVQFQQSLLHIIETVRENSLNSLPTTINNNSIVPIPRNIDLNNDSYDYQRRLSKYYREFIEMEFIAGGGFGQVYKARNNLDGIIYAIKKIKINSTKSKAIMRCISEVKTLARINHINIVPYKTAWIESFLHNPNISNTLQENSYSSSYSNTEDDGDSDEIVPNDCRNREIDAIDDSNDNFDNNNDISIQFLCHSKSIEDEFSDDDIENATNLIISNINYIQCSENDLLKHMNDLSVNRESSDSDSFIVFEDNSKMDCTTFGTHNANDPIEMEKSTKPNSRRECKESKVGKTLKRNTSKSKSRVSDTGKHRTKKYEWATLYIQMSLCQLTLREWLRERNTYSHSKFIEFYRNTNVHFNEDLRCITYNHYTIVNEIFRQILMGIKYIHKINVIHHDIKPQNIFIDIEQNAGNYTIKLGDFGLACPLDKKHTNVGVGTLVYSAPEQMRNICSIKSDIYSLGVVLVELLIDCNTESELVHVLHDIKCKRYVDHQIPKHYLNVIQRLLQKDFKKRPDIHELSELLMEIHNVDMKKLTEDRNAVTINNENVKSKYASTKELDQEIEKLKQLLNAKEEERLRVMREIELFPDEKNSVE